jgi:hypothetical protein
MILQVPSVPQAVYDVIYLNKFDLILVGIVLLVIMGFTNWLITYLTKSAEYKAINENIEAVTEKVESVKGEVDLLIDRKKNIASEERLAIFAYHEKLVSYANFVTGSATYGTTVEELEAGITSIRASHLEYLHSQSRLELLIDEANLHQKIGEMNAILLRGSAITGKVLIDLQVTAKKVLLLDKKKVDSSDLYLEALKQTSKEQSQLRSNYILDILPIYKEYISKKVELEGIIRPLLKGSL